ncbi:hypothetical protein LWI29_006784 [Acer saccharum]|uniref:Uncharacterized protein n=1 Tax=Acer saccharum TaxID=4024 RepID=A0AA39RRD0_ACESA|nr:hypothetical protein LWI29_006784 [Acer saccharum]
MSLDPYDVLAVISRKRKAKLLWNFLLQSPEDASAARSCDGCSFSGCILRIRHPKDFIDVARKAMTILGFPPEEKLL